MEVTCRRCGAGVPAENAFCAECGAVMSEDAPRTRREDPSALLSATISGVYGLNDFKAAEPPPAPAASADAHGPATSGRRAAAPSPADDDARPNLSDAPEAAGRRSTLFLVAGFAALLALGVLLIYLIRLIMRG